MRTLPVATAAAPAVLERLQAQQKALEPLLGAGVPRLRLCGQLPDGRVYVAVEALRGASLQAAWADEPTAHKLSLLAQVANLLVRAHARGLAHGQLTAEAVWVVPPRSRHLPKAVVLDLGVRAALAKEATADLPQHDLRAFADLVQTLLMGPDADAAARPHGAVGQELEALLAHCHRPGVAAADMLPTLTSALQCAAEGVMDTDMRPVAMAAANLTLSPPGGSPAATDPLMGIQIGNWLLTRKLGQGGMGAVYEAVHHQIHRLAAVKVMHPYLAHNPQYATRFLNEARAVNLAPHPDLVEIIDFNRTEEGLLYLVMELLHGETLRAHLERKRSGLPLPEALSITLQLARALADVHKRGIVHRDLKPENVMLLTNSGKVPRIKVLDFGIAKLAPTAATGEADASERAATLGTLGYMAPEQHGAAEEVTGKADVFSLGVMLCELLSGVLPYEGAHLPGSKRPARSLRDLLPDAPEVLTQLLSRMVAPDAAERPTMEEVARILTPLAAPKSRTALWAGLGAAGVLMTLGALLLVQGARAPAEPSSYAAAQAQQQALFAQALRTLQQGVLSPEARVRDHALGEAGKTHVGQLLGDVLRVLDAAVTRGDQPTAVTALVAVGALGQPAAVSRLNYLIAAQPQSRGPMGSAPAQAAAAALYALSLDSGRQLLEDALTDPRLASERELRASAARHLLRARAVGRAVQTPLRELAGAVQPSTFVLEHHLPPCSDTVLLASAGDNAARHALLPVFRDYSQGPLCARLAAAVLLRADGPLDSELDEAQKSARKRLLQQADQAGSPEQVPAARELCLAGQADSVPPVLLAAARSGSEPSQLQAVDALAVCGGYTVLPALVPLLTTGSPLVRITAAGAVLRILGEPTDGAGRATGTETDLPSVSVPLAQELEALRLLVQNSQADADALRLDVRTLGSLGMRPVLRALAPRLGDAQPEVRAAALLALAELDTELSGKLPEGERREVGELLHQRAMQAAQPTANSSVSLRAIGLSVLHLQGDDEPIAPLQAMLVGDAPLLVKETIARLAPLRSPLLAQSLASELPASVRLIAAVRLAEAGDGRDAVRAVLGEAVREHGGQALLAYAMLHKLGHAVDSHPDFHAALQPGQRLTVRFDAVSALQWLPLPEAPPLLRIARADPAVVVRSRAIDMVALHLHRCPTPAQRRMLIDVLRSLQSDAEFSVRLKVARTLSQWQSRESTLCDGKVREEITAPQPAPPPALLLRPLPPSAPPSTPALADVPPPAAASAGRTETLTASRPTSPRALVEAQLERVRELERRRNIDEALAVLEALQDRHGDSLSSEQQERIRHAISRMRPNQGGIIIWSPASGACRKQRTQWYLPGPVAIKNPSGGGDIKAFIRRGQIQRVHLCTSGK